MKWIFSFLILLTLSAESSTFIGNGGQTGDVELAVSLKQIRSAIERIELLSKEDPTKRFCVCPVEYVSHNLCEIIEKLDDVQKQYCDRFLLTQLKKLDQAAQQTQFEWVQSSMLNQNKVGIRVVDAVTQKDKKLIYIDQSRFVDLDSAKRLFLVTHELFHIDNFEVTVESKRNGLGFVSKHPVVDSFHT